MAGKNRGKSPDIKDKLLKEGPLYSFVQALRLLRFVIGRETGRELDDNELYNRIRVRPELSLTFPESDITSIEKIPGKDESDIRSRFSITVTFLGLYGSSSPLPTFYTEDLLDEQSLDKSITREFLDVLNLPLYHLYFKIWSKYRLFYNIAEKLDQESLERLYCLLGLGEERLRTQVDNSFALLKYLGLVTQFPRSAEGLRSLLSDRLDEPSFRIIQCVPRVAEIPADQRLILGISANRLGDNCYLGLQIPDRQGKFRVRIGPVDSDTFHRFLPDRPNFSSLNSLVRFYLNQPLCWDMEILIESRDIEPARLGEERWSQLGWNCWIFTKELPSGTNSVRLDCSEN
ncbi:MAG TPA: type VI secretion system baseplate subunit TssG [archaeon]|nr:type VI secretion system baseplate subunit TssG [archaeon]